MATSDHGAQTPIWAKGSSKCPHHRGKEVVYICEHCKELVCVSCVSKLHRGHEFVELADVIPNAKTNIQDFIDKSEKNEMPQIKRKIQIADIEMLQKNQDYQQEIDKIESQNEILKEELDKATRKLVKAYRDMEKHDMNILENHKTVLKAQADDRSSLILEYKDTLRSGNNVQVFNVLSDLPSEFKDIPTPILPTPSFIPGKFTLLQLEKLVGEVTKRPPHQTANYSVVSKFTPYKHHYVKSIHPAPGNTVWICLTCTDSKCINRMLLVNHKGKIQQTLDTDGIVNDLCVSPVSGNLWYCGLIDFTVREVRRGGSVLRFITGEEPYSICLTADNHVVIGRLQEVVKHTQTGVITHNTPGGDDPMVIYPHHISQCPNTGHLAVVDLDRLECGGSGGSGSVCILDDQLNLLHKCKHYTPGRQFLTEPFYPSDACYTANGSLVITDNENKCVLLVDEKGEYLQTLYTFRVSKPLSVCVHHDGVLWVSFSDGVVKLLKSL